MWQLIYILHTTIFTEMLLLTLNTKQHLNTLKNYFENQKYLISIFFDYKHANTNLNGYCEAKPGLNAVLKISDLQI